VIKKVLMKSMKWALKNPKRKDFVKGLLGEESRLYNKFRNLYYRDEVVCEEMIPQSIPLIQVNAGEMLEQRLRSMTMEQLKLFMAILEAEEVTTEEIK